MTRYSTADEEAVRLAARVRDWKESGLLDAAHATSIDAELQTSLKRTNLVLRLVLFFFSTLVILAAIGLFVTVVRPDSELVSGQLCAAGAIACFGMAELLISRFHLYRFGVEEACAVMAVGLSAASALLSVSGLGNSDQMVMAGLVVATVVSAVVYLRFGYLYAALASAAGAAMIPFSFELPELTARVLSAAILLVMHFALGAIRRSIVESHRDSDYGTLHALTWMGLYAVINLRLEVTPVGAMQRSDIPSAFYWATYVAIWVLPVIGLWRGARSKDRGLIRANLVLALATLVTNKPYLGQVQHTWDPILLGVFLIAAAIISRRWLATGADGARAGFTATRLLASDQRALGHIAMATAAISPQQSPARDAPPDQPFSGGRSGGAGAGADF